jgi:hypothetical protein
MSDFVFEDFNGDTYLPGAAGEREEHLNSRVVAVPPGMPFDYVSDDDFDPSVAAHQQYLDLFFRINYWYYVSQTVERPAPVQGVQGIRTPDLALAARIRKIAYVRAMAARMCQYHYTGTPAGHHTRYAEFEVYTWASLQAFARDIFEDNTIVINSRATALAEIRDVPNVRDDRVWRNNYRSKHLDVVCIVAYFFRVRGHHWISEMDDRYKSVWRKCLYDEDSPGIDWQYLAHDALHAIFPDDLDDIWVEAADNQACAGALVKRVNSMPAGVAIIAAINAGMSDLRLIVPHAFDHVRPAVEHMEYLNRLVDGDRNAGSVNRRLYNAPDVTPNETLLGPLAAIIVASLDTLTTNSPLLKSAALKRVANNAPMTGGLVGKMINNAAKSEVAAAIFLPAGAIAGAGVT